MKEQLTLFRADFLVSHSAPLDNAKERKMNATCGAKCLEQYKRLNPNMSLRKMSLVSRLLMGDWYSTRCALIWKMKGTKFNRLLFQLVPKTLRTEGIDAGLLLKTPCSADAYTGNMTKKEQVLGNSGTLAQEVQTGFIYQRGLLPTPSVSDTEGSPKRPETLSQGKSGSWYRTSDNTGTKFGAKLNDVARLLPTPTAQDSKHSTHKSTSWEERLEKNHLAETVLNPYIQEKGGKTSQLNPRFVAEMMGFPPNWTELPFQSGEKNR
jgi:hypothetical protein